MIVYIVLCHAMHCDALRCHGDELLSIVPRKSMECYEFKMSLVVLLRCVFQNITMWGSKDLLNFSKCYSNTKYYFVLQSTMPVLLCTTKYYASIGQYYSVIKNTTPVLLSTTKYYNILVQYYSVLQNTFPILLYIRKTTTLILLQYCKVLLCFTPKLQRITPIRFNTTMYYSNIILYYNIFLQYYSVLQNTIPVL